MLRLQPSRQSTAAAPAATAIAVPPTEVEEEAVSATAPLAARTQQSAYDIEMELLATAPRRVVASAHTRTARLFHANFVVGAVLLAWFLMEQYVGPGNNAKFPRGLLMLCLMAGTSQTITWLSGELQYTRERARLRRWRPVAAKVTEWTAKTYGNAPTAELRYRYEVVPGEFAEGTWVTSAAIPLQPGDYFTLLQDPRRPRRVVPYAALTLAHLA